jgi:hypothetical protein
MNGKVFLPEVFLASNLQILATKLRVPSSSWPKKREEDAGAGGKEEKNFDNLSTRIKVTLDEGESDLTCF